MAEKKETEATDGLTEVERLKREMMKLRLELRRYEEFIEFNPDLHPRWKEYEERLRTPQVDHLTYPRHRGETENRG